ncbi:ankyrin [Apiospora arundinis]
MLRSGRSFSSVIALVALVEAKLDDSYKKVFESTCLLVFFATPHQGGAYANVGELAVKLFKIGQLSNDLLKALSKNANDATRRFEQARHLSDECLVISFYEGETLGLAGIIVDKRSATLNLSGMREKQVAINADHSSICKLNPSDRDTYELVLGTVEEQVQRALACRSTRGTGIWFLESDRYKAWLEDSPQSLFCSGIPGAGKTIITSVVINDLRRLFKDAEIAICYVYCIFGKEDQDTHGLMLSLLKQLAETKYPVPDAVKRLYGDHAMRHTRPLLSETLGAIRSVAATYKRVFVIVDALDEFREQSRAEFISELLAFQSGLQINLLVTSRPIPDISNHYLTKRVSEPIGLRSAEQALSDEVINTLTEASKGMFLLAKLHMDSLRDKVTQKDIQNALKEISSPSSSAPRPYHYAYDAAMNRVMHQLPGFKSHAEKVLGWVAYAKQQLHQDELLLVVSLEHDRTSIDPANIPKIDDLISFCAGLVNLNKANGLVSFIHHTTREYFDSNKERWFPNFDQEIAATCASYLSFNVFTNELCLTLEDLHRRFREHRFFEYATRHWGSHARASQTCEAVLRFLKRDTAVNAADQGRRFHRRRSISHYYKETISFIHGRIGLHLAAVLDLREAVDALLQTYTIETKDNQGLTALTLCAQSEQWDMVKFLKQRGASVHAPNNQGETPLLFAAKWADETTVKFLIDHGADVNAQSTALLTPLLVASNFQMPGAAQDAAKRWGVIKCLIEKGADATAKDYFGTTALHQIARSIFPEGWEAIAKCLIDHGAQVNAKNTYGHTVLHEAMRVHSYDFRIPRALQFFIEHGADPNVQNKKGETPLSLAHRLGVPGEYLSALV